VWVVTHVHSRIVGPFQLVWQVCLSIFKPGGLLPSSHSRGPRLYSSSAASGRLNEIVRLEVHRIHDTSSVPHWLLISEWGAWRELAPTKYGQYEAAGAERSKSLM